ncbi:MAG: hypothetical protein CME06_15680 [Gemmatimonadetes bacterium]|nr:hypothetical protein [Gemmatimonadota bacterium]
MKESNRMNAAISAAALAVLVGMTVTSRTSAIGSNNVPIEARSRAALRIFGRDAATQIAMRLAATRPQPQESVDTVRVVVVKSSIVDTATTNWIDELTTEWRTFGDLPLVFDRRLERVASFTLADLRAADPHAIWIASPVWTDQEFSPREMIALETMQMREGTTIVGTGLVLGGSRGSDNRHLGPIFGIDTSNRIFDQVHDATVLMSFDANVPPELADSLPIGTPFGVTKKLRAERESSRAWSDDLMLDGRIVAMGEPDSNSVEVFVERGEGVGIYFSSPHEYTPGLPLQRSDPQLLYNAFTYGLSGAGVVGGDVFVDGEPFVNRPVLLADGTVGCTYRDRTDSAGIFAFDDVLPGVYSLEIPNIVNVRSAEVGDEGVMVADGAIEVNGVAMEEISVYAVRIDTIPIQVVGPELTDLNGDWELEIPDWGQWIIWAPGIGVVATE